MREGVKDDKGQTVPLAVKSRQHHVCGVERMHKVRWDGILLLHDIWRMTGVAMVHKLYLLQVGLHLLGEGREESTHTRSTPPPPPNHAHIPNHAAHPPPPKQPCSSTHLHSGPFVIWLNYRQSQWCYPLNWLASTTNLPGTLCQPILATTKIAKIT